ncbi:hypothetical protein [Streptomyces sp. NPDC097981]|uniref:hypothetical protein n=1 Tax=Streptomyces sp. NPDC097981 TaxID=3155428 RepID=UPI003321B50D
MSSPDGARWNPRSQRWEWGEQPAQPGPTPTPAPAPAPAPTPAPAVTPQHAQPTQPAQPGRLPPPPPAPGWYEPGAPQPPAPSGPYGPGGAGPDGRPQQQWRMPLLVGVVAAVVGGVSVAAWMLLGGKDAPAANTHPLLSASPSAAADTPSTSASPSPGPGGPASPSPSASTGGPGYTVVHNEAGFSVAVPTGWEPSHNEQGSGAFYRLPGDRSALLQIFRITEDSSTASCELLRMSSQRLNDGTPAYRQVSLEPVAASACELVYEYDSAESHGRRRGVERITTTPDGKRWALLAAGPAADTSAVRANLTAALESFRPD